MKLKMCKMFMKNHSHTTTMHILQCSARHAFSAFWKQNCNPKFKTVKLYFNTQLGFYVGTVRVLN